MRITTPVIIEYKRSTNDNVISQGLFYLDWLMDHKAEFQLLVQNKFGKELADSIEWMGPRLICIAGGFTKYDQYAVKQISRNIELVRYTYFGEEYLTLELVNSNPETSIQEKSASVRAVGENVYKTFTEYLNQSDASVKDLYYEVASFCKGLGDDVQAKTLKFYQAYKRIKNFACVEVRPQLKQLLVFFENRSFRHTNDRRLHKRC